MVVEPEEDAVPAGERGNDDVDGNERPREAGEGDERSGRTTSAREREPDPQPDDRQPHELARRHRESRRRRRRDEAIGVQEPDAEEEQRDRERHGMDRCEGTRRDPRICEIAQSEKPRDPIVSEMTPAQPEHRERPQRHHRDLRERERERRRPEHPQRREQHEERIGVTAEAHHLLARWRRASISSGLPCDVLQTACTMFPRSNRPTRKVTNASRARAKSTAVHPTIAAATARSPRPRANEPGRLDRSRPAA